MSDEALLPRERPAPTAGGAKAEAGATVQRESHVDASASCCACCSRSRSAWAMVFWPYPSRCGPWLFGYLGGDGRGDERAACGARCGRGAIARAGRTSCRCCSSLWGVVARRRGGAAAHRLRRSRRRGPSGGVAVRLNSRGSRLKSQGSRVAFRRTLRPRPLEPIHDTSLQELHRRRVGRRRRQASTSTTSIRPTRTTSSASFRSPAAEDVDRAVASAKRGFEIWRSDAGAAAR